MMAPRVLIAAGGTGGHVFPALAVAQELRRRGWHTEWVGSDRGLEARVIPGSEIGLHILRFSGLRGKGAAAWFSLPFRLLSALRDARAIVMRARPQVVVAFGGYVTFPVGLIARLRHIPLCVHEQNAVMGTANRWLAIFARCVMVSFPKTRFAPASARVTGNPVRQSITGLADPAQRYEQRSGAYRILVVGGSLGARALNGLVPEAVAQAAKSRITFEVRHQCGTQELADVKMRYQTLGLRAECSPFIDDIQEAYGWADLLICRAGASTVTEVACAGIATLFVPLPSAIDDHQTANARYLADQEAAWLMPQSSLTKERLGEFLATLNRDVLRMRAQKARSLAMTGATARVADLVTETLKVQR